MRTRTVAELLESALAVLEEDPGQALTLAREAARRQPDAESFYVLGLASCETEDSEAGLDALRMAVKLDAEHVDAWVALGRELFDVCEEEEAQAALLTALRLELMARWPSFPPWHGRVMSFGSAFTRVNRWPGRPPWCCSCRTVR